MPLSSSVAQRPNSYVLGTLSVGTAPCGHGSERRRLRLFVLLWLPTCEGRRFWSVLAVGGEGFQGQTFAAAGADGGVYLGL
jgi:hypothetical protein